MVMSIWTDLVVVQEPVLEKILRTVIVYAVVVVLFRFGGRRGLAALNTFDFVVLFVLSNVLQNAIIGNDNSVLGGVIGAVTLVVVNAGLNLLATRYPRLGTLLEGRPIEVIRHGSVDQSVLKRLAMSPGDLEFAVRLQNGSAVHNIQHGYLDPGGHLVLTLKREARAATAADIAGLVGRLESIEQLLTPGASGEQA